MALLEAELLAGRTPITHGGVVGQIWKRAGLLLKLTRKET
jgi:hypothetical protein